MTTGAGCCVWIGGEFGAWRPADGWPPDDELIPAELLPFDEAAAVPVEVAVWPGRARLR